LVFLFFFLPLAFDDVYTCDFFLAKVGGVGFSGAGSVAGGSSFFGPDEKNLSMLTIFFKNPHYWESWRSSKSYGSS